MRLLSAIPFLLAGFLCLGSPIHVNGDDAAVRSFLEIVTGSTWEHQGERVAHDSYRSCLGGSFVWYSSTGLVSGKQVGMIGKDPVTENWTWWLFYADGSVKRTTIEAESVAEKTLRIRISDESGDSLLDYELVNENDRIVMKGKGQIDGESLPVEMTWKRTPLVDQEWLTVKEPAELGEQWFICQKTLGPKWMHAVSGSKTAVGASNGRWILDGKFFEYVGGLQSADGEQFSHVVFTGRDPESGKVKMWEFGSGGATSSVKISDDGKRIDGIVQRPEGRREWFSGTLEMRGSTLTYVSKIGDRKTADIPYSWQWYPSTDNRLGARQVIHELEKQWSVAMVDWDKAWFENVLADDFHFVGHNGESWDRATYIGHFESGRLKCSKYEVSDLQIRCHDSTAVVQGKGSVVGEFQGTAFRHGESWTSTYVQIKGRWKCVSCHVSKLADSAK